MKTKLLIMISLLNWAFIASSNDAKSNSQTMAKSERFEVIVDVDDGEVTRKIIVNGKELSDEEIKEFEASGKMKILHMDSSYLSKSGNNVFMVKGDSSDHGGNHMVNKFVTKSGAGDEEVQVFIEQEGDKTTERIIVNGEQLSDEEIEEFKASGKMKVISVTSDMVVVDGNKRIFINSDSEHGGDIDIEVIMDKIGDLQGLHHDNSTIKEWISEDGKNIKIISKSKGVFIKDDNSASLGFMANIEDDGWHLTRIMDKSGAKDAGILTGDVVTRIDNVDMTRNPSSDKVDFSMLPKFEPGDMVKVILERTGKQITFDVQARVLDKSEMVFDLQVDGSNNIKWVEKLHKDVTSNIKVMVFDSKSGDFQLNEEDIHMVFPEKLGKMNFFISDGDSTSKLLGKHHEMSSMSDGLSKYFNTSGGVLVLHVDKSNAFNLQDGDVIKTINGNKVKSPKDVIKQIINVDKQEHIKMKVVRNKKSKTLKYEK